MNNDENNIQEQNPDGQEENKSFLLLYIAIGCFALGTILLGLSIGLSFVVSGVGVYLLIASLISELASLTLLNAQKRHGVNKLCTVIRILSYIIMAIGVLIFAFGAAIGINIKD